MTTGHEIREARYAEEVDRLVTSEFAPLADFAGFGGYEAAAVRETGAAVEPLIDGIAADIAGYLTTRPETARPLQESGEPVDRSRIAEWLHRTAAGPFDGDLSGFLRETTHLPGGRTTVPGVPVPLPPRMVPAVIAWTQGRILDALGETCDSATVSAAGAAWMNQFVLQLGIILEPGLAMPDQPLGEHRSDEFHEYAELAGFGGPQRRILDRTGPLLEPAGGGVVAMAYDYLLSRPESAGYFQDPDHLAMRKESLKGWWARSTGRPMDAGMHSYLSRVADTHVKGGGRNPHVVVPPELTIALMGWVEMRVMTALNTIAPGDDGHYVFGEPPDPPAAAHIGTAWMRMLTLQLGILLKPYLTAPAGTD